MLKPAVDPTQTLLWEACMVLEPDAYGFTRCLLSSAGPPLLPGRCRCSAGICGLSGRVPRGKTGSMVGLSGIGVAPLPDWPRPYHSARVLELPAPTWAWFVRPVLAWSGEMWVGRRVLVAAPGGNCIYRWDSLLEASPDRWFGPIPPGRLQLWRRVWSTHAVAKFSRSRCLRRVPHPKI